MNLTNCRCWVEETNKCVCSVTTLRSVEQFTFAACLSLNIVPCVVSGPEVISLLKCKCLVVSEESIQSQYLWSETQILPREQNHIRTSESRKDEFE